MAFNVESAVSGYKDALAQKEKEVHELHRQLGKRMVELEWVSKKLKRLAYNDRKSMIDTKLKAPAVVRQCERLSINPSNVYYTSQIDNKEKMGLLEAIDDIYTEIPFYGYRKVHQQLIERGFSVGVNRVRSCIRELGLKTIYPTKAVKTTLANPAHRKYPYLLKDIAISRANQVWSTDITYVRVHGGFMYLAAVIDWHSKAILSHKLSNTMDNTLVMEVLKDAIANYGKPEIFNTDQGSQYTSHAHTRFRRIT